MADARKTIEDATNALDVVRMFVANYIGMLISIQENLANTDGNIIEYYIFGPAEDLDDERREAVDKARDV